MSSPRQPRDTTPVCPDCGWTRETPTTAALAAHALQLHSCAKQRRADESKARGLARDAAVAAATVVRDCHHKHARHVHGTHAAYVLDRCRCPDCRKAARAYEHRRTRQRAYGIEAYVDAEPVRAHVRGLMAAGLGLKRVAAMSGVPHGALAKLIYGGPNGRAPSRRVRPATAERLLAVRATLDDLGATIGVDGTGTTRRLRALACLGWSAARLATACGVNRQAIDRALNTETGHQVQAATARAVRDLYDRLWATPAPERDTGERISGSRARRRAARLGYAPPLAWDDDTIDDPGATPATGETDPVGVDEVLVERLADGADWRALGATRAERIAAAELMDARGEYRNRIEAHLGVQAGRDFGRSAA